MAKIGDYEEFLSRERKFTEILDNLADSPQKLYAYGRLKYDNDSGQAQTSQRPKAVAIVGSRRNTLYGAEIAYKMAYELAKRGVIIVSGLAYGIDSISHRGAVDAGGVTVAVLGTPIDEIYPACHEDLARKIIECGGMVMSEYAPRDKVHFDAPLTGVERIINGERYINKKLSFLERNRLISGLSDIVVVVEAAERSGTLNTAAHALSQGRSVFAVPGNITNFNSVGCNRLIAEGAVPYTGLNDLLDILDLKEPKIRKTAKSLKGDTEEETAILKLIASGLKNGEEIVERLKLSAEKFSQAITFLEIKGQVRPLGANNWALTV